MQFHATTAGPDSLGLCQLLERFAAEQWIPSSATPEHASAIILDLFKRRILDDLGAIELRAE